AATRRKRPATPAANRVRSARSRTRRPYTVRMSFGRRLLASLLAPLLLLVAVSAAASHLQPSAVAGRLPLAQIPDEPTALQGEWGFAWQRFVDPNWQDLPTGALAKVPASWNELTADGKTPGENGWGSYVLRIDCPVGRSLAVEANGQRTA